MSRYHFFESDAIPILFFKSDPDTHNNTNILSNTDAADTLTDTDIADNKTNQSIR